MEPYAGALFIHVTSAAAMFAGIGVLSVCEVMIRNAETLDRLRMLGRLAQRTARGLIGPSILLLASALYLVHSQWGFREPWVSASFAVFIYLVLTGPLVFGKRIGAAVAAAVAAGTISPDVRRRLHDPVLAVFGGVRIACLVLLVFLMTVKPDALATLLAILVAVAIGILMGVRLRATPANQ